MEGHEVVEVSSGDEDDEEEYGPVCTHCYERTVRDRAYYRPPIHPDRAVLGYRHGEQLIYATSEAARERGCQGELVPVAQLLEGHVLLQAFERHLPTSGGGERRDEGTRTSGRDEEEGGSAGAARVAAPPRVPG